MSASPTIEYLEQQIVEALKRIDQLTALIQVLVEKMDAGDARAAIADKWTKMASDNGLQAMKWIKELNARKAEDSADMVKLVEIVNMAVERGAGDHERIADLEKKMVALGEGLKQLSTAKLA
jgi:hypothetical protein